MASSPETTERPNTGDRSAKGHASDGARTARVIVTGLLEAAGIACCTASALAFLSGLWWPLDLAAHFRVQYSIVCAALVPPLLCLKRRVSPAVLVSFLLLNVATLVPLYVPPPGQLDPKPPTCRLLLFNVNAANTAHDNVLAYIRETSPDVVVLEEVTGALLNRLQELRDALPYSVARPREDNFGIALLSRYELTTSDIVQIASARVPSIIADVAHPEGSFTVIATHPTPPIGPTYSAWRNEQLEKLARRGRDIDGPLLVAGDLNTSPWSRHFARLLRHGALLDSARGFGVQPTWPSFNPLLRIPIDHVLHSPHIQVSHRHTGPSLGSDHSPVVVDFSMAYEGAERPTNEMRQLEPRLGQPVGSR